ncbi:hypothetical protein PRIPAC_78071 [Pristionchus pacificus]|uniref:Chaperone n=1 Tax=Pristionchus pacificus TaxID=54126 RepID=A0A2A6BYY9_PRIPA|nr:hypothetical protein PRIPAC_78071 [Pristionchus pacificus]|eukprot:PDM71047.1 Chaperone [Pristionchus pacificus]
MFGFHECSMLSFYEILGVKENCSVEEIKAAYHKLLIKNHPDKGIDKADITIQLVALIGKTLKDGFRREHYDRYEIV